MFSEVPEKPSDCPKTTVKSSGGEYLSLKFNHARAKHFPSFRNFAATVLDTVTIEFVENNADLINII